MTLGALREHSTLLNVEKFRAVCTRTDDGAPCSSSSRRAASCVCLASCPGRLQHTQHRRFIRHNDGFAYNLGVVSPADNMRAIDRTDATIEVACLVS